MSYIGSWKIDDLLTFVCNTHDPTDGSASDADSPPSYRIYEDETSTPILTGSMALLDSTNTDGFYSEQITLSAANGFEKGKCYSVYISATVNSITGTMSHTFQMEAEVDANTVTDTVNLSATIETQIDNIETDTNSLNDTKIAQTLNLTASGNIGIDWANVENPTTVVDLSATDINLVDTASVLTAYDASTDFNATQKASINSEVSDVVKTDTVSEMTQQAPPATPTIEEAIMYLYMAVRNQLDVTSSNKSFYNDSGTVIWKKALTDNGTTYSEAEGVTGP